MTKDTVRDQTGEGLKVLLVSHAFPPDVGGAQHVAIQNARALSRVYDVEVLTGTPAPSGWDDQFEFEVTRLNIPFGIWPLQYARAFTARSENYYVTVIFNDPAAIYSAGLAAPSSLLKRGICYLHGSEPEFFFSNPRLIYRLVQFRQYFELGLNRCRVIAPVSEFMKRKFVEQTGLSRLQSKMKVIHAGVDREVFYPDPIQVRKRHDIEDGTDILLSASRLVERKGYGDMLEIFRDLRKEGYPFHWIIAGDGPYRKPLLREIERVGLSKWVTWVGELTQEVLRRYYSAADLFWLLSRFQEAFGLVYVEANACGVPVLGRRRGGVCEAIQDEKTGFLAEDLMECKRILATRKYKGVEKQDVLDWAESFGTGTTAKRLQTIINQVTSNTETEENT